MRKPLVGGFKSLLEYLNSINSMGECFSYKEEVISSNLISSIWDRSSAGRASVLQAESPGFKSQSPILKMRQ